MLVAQHQGASKPGIGAEGVSTPDASDSVVSSLEALARGFAKGTLLELPSLRSASVEEVSRRGRKIGFLCGR